MASIECTVLAVGSKLKLVSERAPQPPQTKGIYMLHGDEAVLLHPEPTRGARNGPVVTSAAGRREALGSLAELEGKSEG